MGSVENERAKGHLRVGTGERQPASQPASQNRQKRNKRGKREDCDGQALLRGVLVLHSCLGEAIGSRQ